MVVMKKVHVVVALIIATFVYWMFRSKRENYEKSEAVIYVETSSTPNPFIVWNMVKKQTTDENVQKKVLRLATEKKKDELLKVLEKI